MWRIGIVLMTGVLALSPKTAFATVYTFQDTESSALSVTPVSFSFSLDTATATTTTTVNGSSTIFSNVVITDNGTSSSGNSAAASFTTDLASPLFFWVDTSLMPFYSGSGTGIVFNTGTFAIADGATDGEGTLIISSGSAGPVSVTPEPAPWLLLLTGGTMIPAFRISAAGRLRESKPAA